MRTFFRWAAALSVLAGCSGGEAPPAPEATSTTAAVSPAVMREVRQATDRSQVQVTTVTLPNGEGLKRASLGSGYQHVVLARRNPDGTLSTACVNTAPAAEAFLSATAGVRQ